MIRRSWPFPTFAKSSKPTTSGIISAHARLQRTRKCCAPLDAGYLPALHQRIRAAGTPARGVLDDLQCLDAATVDKAVEMKVNFYSA
jgi:hypothetical protein